MRYIIVILLFGMLYLVGCANSSIEKPIIIQQPDSLLTESGNIGIAYLERTWLGQDGYEPASQFNFRIQERLRQLRLSGAKVYRIEVNDGRKLRRTLIYYIMPFEESENENQE